VISNRLRKFIRTNVRTIWALEMLLLMCRTQGRSWTTEELNRELRGSISLVTDILVKFEKAELVKREPDDRYRWAPSTPELQEMGKELVSTYSTHPFTVIKAVTETHAERLQSLADAFKIKKD
jgi:Mn-dependent DtxR family transcriptional regulator